MLKIIVMEVDGGILSKWKIIADDAKKITTQSTIY